MPTSLHRVVSRGGHGLNARRLHILLANLLPKARQLETWALDTAYICSSLLLCCLQKKLEPEERQRLIERGQQLKQQLEELEVQLSQVSDQPACCFACRPGMLVSFMFTRVRVSYKSLTWYTQVP